MTIKSSNITPERLEAAMLGLAELVDGKHPDLLPILERLEKDYARLRRPPEVARIKKLIADARREAGLE